VPNNVVLAQAAPVVTGNKSEAWEEFVFTSPYDCQPTKEYFIVANATADGVSDGWVWFGEGAGNYDKGDYAFNLGSGWTAGARELYFRAYGRSETVVPGLNITGKAGDMFGMAVSTAGDINNDGYYDILIGAPNNDSQFGNIVNTGAVYAFYGREKLTNMTYMDADNITYGEIKNSRFGWSVAMAGNVDGDSYLDVIIGAPKYDNNSFTEAGKTYIMSYVKKPKIPEFSSIVLPIFISLILIALIRRKYYPIKCKAGKVKGVRH
jgi:hypothetical protein